MMTPPTPEDLAQLLRALPRGKVTPQSITQVIIDRWYRAEDNYRKRLSAIAELHRPTAHPTRCACGTQRCATAELARGGPPLAAYIDQRAQQQRDELVADLQLVAEDLRAFAADLKPEDGAQAELLAKADGFDRAVAIARGDKAIIGALVPSRRVPLDTQEG